MPIEILRPPTQGQIHIDSCRHFWGRQLTLFMQIHKSLEQLGRHVAAKLLSDIFLHVCSNNAWRHGNSTDFGILRSHQLYEMVERSFRGAVCGPSIVRFGQCSRRYTNNLSTGFFQVWQCLTDKINDSKQINIKKRFPFVDVCFGNLVHWVQNTCISHNQVDSAVLVQCKGNRCG